TPSAHTVSCPSTTPNVSSCSVWKWLGTSCTWLFTVALITTHAPSLSLEVSRYSYVSPVMGLVNNCPLVGIVVLLATNIAISFGFNQDSTHALSPGKSLPSRSSALYLLSSYRHSHRGAGSRG